MLARMALMAAALLAFTAARESVSMTAAGVPRTRVQLAGVALAAAGGNRGTHRTRECCGEHDQDRRRICTALPASGTQASAVRADAASGEVSPPSLNSSTRAHSDDDQGRRRG